MVYDFGQVPSRSKLDRALAKRMGLGKMKGLSGLKLQRTLQDYHRLFPLVDLAEDLIWTPPSPEIVLVSMDFQRLVREACPHVEYLLQLSPRQFEELIAEIWNRFGYEVELTKRTRDRGNDIVAVKKSGFKTRLLIECKRWDPSHRIGVNLVRELYGVKIHNGATKAILATTSYFTAPAAEFIEDHVWELEGQDHDGIV